MKPYGMRVTLRFNPEGRFGQSGTQVYRNVTEVHYNYGLGDTPNPLGIKIAIESDIHGTGTTWPMTEVAEFEVVPETELQEDF